MVPEETNTNWSQSVGAVIISEGKVLLVRHTYGAGKGKLIIPGGYVHWKEMPEEALEREVLEETGVKAEAVSLLGVRFNQKDWYAVFTAKYLSGTARSDGEENSEAVWLSYKEALQRSDVADLTKKLIAAATGTQGGGFKQVPYEGNRAGGTYTLFSMAPEPED